MPPISRTLADATPTEARLALVGEFDALGVVAQVGSEVAAALTSALERVNALTASGSIDRAGLRGLREEIERARRAGMLGQQVSRFASGGVQVVEETLDLTALLREVMGQRSREMDSRGIEVRQLLHPAMVRGDATLLFALLQGAMDWAFEHAASRIDVAVEVMTWPAQARFSCSFAHQPADLAPASVSTHAVAERLQTMSWRLIECCARTLGLQLERCDTGDRTSLWITFANTVLNADAVDTLLDLELDAAPVAGHNSKPLAGSHVLAVSTRREIRSAIRDVVRPMGVMLDFVGSIDEAREFCLGGLPHAIVFEAALGGGMLQRLLAELLAEAPSLACIEIGEQGRPFEVLHSGGREQARVAKDAIAQALPKALLFALARGR